MKRSVDITKSKIKPLPFMNNVDYQDKFQKGWSLPSVYNLSEIRDVFLALKQWDKDEFDFDTFFIYCQNIRLPYVRTEWNKRRLLEHVNALKNFSLINNDCQIKKEAFTSDLGSPLSEDDLLVFRNIYFNYFRFKEIFTWFLKLPNDYKESDFIHNLKEQIIIQDSFPLFSFSKKSRFTDSFIYDLKDNTTIFYIDQSNEDLMRFWDVFIKWGTTLNVIEKFSLRNLEIKTINNKQIACIYVINNRKPNLNLVEFIRQQFSENYIYIPQLVFHLALTFRLSITTVQELIIEQYKVHKEYLSFERTSEIFIKKKEIKNGEKVLFPKYNDSYISHLILRK